MPSIAATMNSATMPALRATVDDVVGHETILSPLATAGAPFTARARSGCSRGRTTLWSASLSRRGSEAPPAAAAAWARTLVGSRGRWSLVVGRGAAVVGRRPRDIRRNTRNHCRATGAAGATGAGLCRGIACGWLYCGTARSGAAFRGIPAASHMTAAAWWSAARLPDTRGAAQHWSLVVSRWSLVVGRLAPAECRRATVAA